MDKLTIRIGEQYEEFMLRAFGLSQPNPVVGADKRHFYLLYMIRNGVDLRETGYDNQLTIIRTYLSNALAQLLEQELHDHEQKGLNKAVTELETVISEQGMGRLIDKLLRITQRFQLQ
jgi:hypothetical protein